MVGSWTRCLSRKALRQHEHSSLIVTGNDKTRLVFATRNKCYFTNTNQLCHNGSPYNSSYRCVKRSAGHAYNLATVPGWTSVCWPNNLLVPCWSHLYLRSGERFCECQVFDLITQYIKPEQVTEPQNTHQSLHEFVPPQIFLDRSVHPCILPSSLFVFIS